MQFMRSIYDSTSRPREDLTARARIRDAAMAQFAERGFRATTIKTIADAAGVSTGLVQHHFGTKDGLRQACDQAAIERIERQLAVIDHLDTAVARPDMAAVLYDASPLLVRYLTRLLIDGAPMAGRLFDQMADATERFLSESRPDLFPPGTRRARDGATMMVVMHMGAAVLHEQVSRRTGLDVWDRASAPRLGLVMLDVYEAMADWISSDTGVQARTAVTAYLAQLTPTADPDEEHDDA
jgi:AcrR family transcriptional regulator